MAAASEAYVLDVEAEFLSSPNGSRWVRLVLRPTEAESLQLELKRIMVR